MDIEEITLTINQQDLIGIYKTFYSQNTHSFQVGVNTNIDCILDTK